jgi:hypothetical protein
MYDQSDFTASGWHVDCDADLQLADPIISLTGENHCAGIDVLGRLQLYGMSYPISDSLEAHGANWWATSWIDWIYNIAINLKFDQVYSIDGLYMSLSTLTLNASGCKVSKIEYPNGGALAVGVDILAGADDCSIDSSNFKDNTTAAIRSAAQRTRISGCKFTSTGAHKTILDTGAGDYTLGVGNIGVNTGGGMTLGANSQVIVGTGINLA